MHEVMIGSGFARYWFQHEYVAVELVSSRISSSGTSERSVRGFTGSDLQRICTSSVLILSPHPAALGLLICPAASRMVR